MSQQIGLNFKTRIPTFSDDASIQEAFSVYHFGVDNYTTQAIPEDSIEGHFTTLNARVTASEDAIANLGTTFVESTSLASAPNIINSEEDNVIPLSVRGHSATQAADLQRWATSGGTPVAKIFPNGGMSIESYFSIGEVTENSPTSSALRVNVGGAGDRGITVSANFGQTADLQQWVVDGFTIAKVDASGKLYSNNGLTGTDTSEVVTLAGSQALTNKTLTAPTITNGGLTTPTISTPTITDPTITGGSISNMDSITLTGDQLYTSTVRNITVSTSVPGGGNDGDIWIRYV